MTDKNDDLILNAIIRVERRQDEMFASIVDIKVDSARNTQNLETHMRRTAALETLVQQNEDKTEQRLDKLEIGPKAAKLIVQIALGLSAIAGAIFTILKLL
jgi:hypothetical protein